MEYQNIEKTRCCHRLYELLVRSSEQPLIGEPWFRFVSGGLYFSSRTKSEMVANLEIGKRGLDNYLVLNPNVETSDYAPIKNLLLEEDRNLGAKNLSKKQKDVILCRILGDFFRLNYQKLG